MSNTTTPFFANRIKTEGHSLENYEAISEKLLRIHPNSIVVPAIELDVNFDNLMNNGVMMPPDYGAYADFPQGELNGCHPNVTFLKKAGVIDTAYTGFVLSDDGMWRYHSWGVKGDSIIETTLLRPECGTTIAYFGAERLGLLRSVIGMARACYARLLR